MEYAQNGSLLDTIRRDIFIDENRSRKWFKQLIDAVDYCHTRGVVHRYLKYSIVELHYRGTSPQSLPPLRATLSPTQSIHVYAYMNIYMGIIHVDVRAHAYSLFFKEERASVNSKISAP